MIPKKDFNELGLPVDVIVDDYLLALEKNTEYRKSLLNVQQMLNGADNSIDTATLNSIRDIVDKALS